MEIWFYHLQRQPLARALPALIEKAREREWRVVVQTVDDLRLKALDDLLWTYKPDSFLPHGSAGEKGAKRQPILVTRGPDNANNAALRCYVEGAEILLDPANVPYERVMLVFDGSNEAELTAARGQWTRLKTLGFTLAYWQQADDGRWEKRM